MSKLYLAFATQPCATGIGAMRSESRRARGIRSSRVVSGRATGIGQVDATREAAVSATARSCARQPKNESSIEKGRWALSAGGRDVDC
jgi:hypothetical protein